MFPTLSRSVSIVLICSALWLVPASTVSAILLVDYASVIPIGSPINFTEVPYGTRNPVYRIGPPSDTLQISFGSHFLGQSLGGTANTLADASPTGPLTLATSAPVATSIDLAQKSVALGGGSVGFFTTPISILFDQSVSAVGFRAGHFQDSNNVLMEAFDRSGQSLGIVRNVTTGVQSLGLRSSQGRNEIAGVSLYLLPGSMDWEGFTIDDVIAQKSVTPPDEVEQTITPVPEPTGVAMVAGILLAGRVFRSRGD